ncbi:MAG: Rid family hydrolase [Candidatus Marinimicrobia bacterium]|jgi:2-aminomuconate deaminase|nr:Rid family hydrolase [Candidatus Neomarinimicrobiota bacterium]|tara:strand:+ start:6482 stop:6904 length:423 start_codon:yes stop_codon:yes gene_type:complete
MNETVNTDKAPVPVGKYPHARKVGNLLFLSGVGPRRPGTNVIPGVMMDGQGNAVGHDIEAQCHSVFENVKIILDEAGSDWNNLVDITVFLTNMNRDFDIFNSIYGDYFIDNQPCRTTVEVTSLPTPIAIELKCIATIDNQ